jgi:hypothetical protein
MARKNEQTPEISVDDALRALYADYFTEIRALATEALSQPEDTREDWLHETIDGHGRVIYTHKAKLVGICTDHPDACEDETGETPKSPEAAAYWSMLADVRDLLGNSYFLADHGIKADE